MSKNPLFAGIVAVMLAGGLPAVAQNNDPITALIQSELTGVQNIKKNNDGAIRSLTVIGRAPISRALPMAKAKQVASAAALRNAKAEFAKFLKTEVTASSAQDGSVTIATKGAAGGDEGDAKSIETADAIEVSSEKYAEFAAAAITGLQQIGAGVWEDSYTVVMGWDVAAARQIKQLTGQAPITTPPPTTGPTAEIHPEPVAHPAVEPGQNKPVQPANNAAQNAGDFF